MTREEAEQRSDRRRRGAGRPTSRCSRPPSPAPSTRTPPATPSRPAPLAGRRRRAPGPAAAAREPRGGPGRDHGRRPAPDRRPAHLRRPRQHRRHRTWPSAARACRWRWGSSTCTPRAAAGCRSHGVDFPGHFLLRVETDEGPVALDPFSRGPGGAAVGADPPRPARPGLTPDVADRLDVLMAPVTDRAGADPAAEQHLRPRHRRTRDYAARRALGPAPRPARPRRPPPLARRRRRPREARAPSPARSRPSAAPSSSTAARRSPPGPRASGCGCG